MRAKIFSDDIITTGVSLRVYDSCSGLKEKIKKKKKTKKQIEKCLKIDFVN